MNKNKKSFFNIISGAILALITLISIVSFARTIRFIIKYHYSFSFGSVLTILSIIGFVALAVALFLGRRDNLGAAGFAVPAAVSAISFIYGLISIISFSLDYKFYFRYVFDILSDILNLAGWLGLFALAVICLTEFLPDYREQAKKIWFVPAICAFLSLIGGGVFVCILKAAAILTASLWIVYPDGMPVKSVSTGNAGTVQPQSKPVQINPGVPDELRKYKALLDSGAITQEEFDAKKKELLGL